MTEPVRVAHDRDFPPFAEVKGGKSEGLTVDIFRAAAARAAVEVKFVPVSFEERQLTLEDGRAVCRPRSHLTACNCSTLPTNWLLLAGLYLYEFQTRLPKISLP
jgi:hypothetical protein